MSIRARLQDLLAFADPWDVIPWRRADGLSRDLVADAIRTGDLCGDPVGPEADLARHVARIAWLVVNGWNDPIQVDVGCPSLPGWRDTWPITDGNHRLAAAAYRGDACIDLEWGGEVERARRILGAELIDADLAAMAEQAAMEEEDSLDTRRTA